MNRKVYYQILVSLLSPQWFFGVGALFIRLVIKTYIFKLGHWWPHSFACLHNIPFTDTGGGNSNINSVMPAMTRSPVPIQHCLK